MSQDLVYAAVARSVQKAIKQEPKKVRRVVKEPSMHSIGEDEPEHLESDEVTLSRQYLENREAYEELYGDDSRALKNIYENDDVTLSEEAKQARLKYNNQANGQVQVSTRILSAKEIDEDRKKPPSIDVEV